MKARMRTELVNTGVGGLQGLSALGSVMVAIQTDTTQGMVVMTKFSDLIMKSAGTMERRLGHSGDRESNSFPTVQRSWSDRWGIKMNLMSMKKLMN